jgi:lipopolysaccharide export system permease protein
MGRRDHRRRAHQHFAAGRFAQLDQNLTIRIRERQPGGILAGIFVDDRRDPKERVTIIADHGTVLKNESGSFLVLEDGNLEKFEAGKRDPALVAFGRYAFDMSKFSAGRDFTLGIRERYVWELMSPSPDDPVYKQVPGQFRAELHDRFMSPIYPFAFAALTFAFLGSPRTTRQSRSFAIGGSILAVLGLRGIGFACSVLTVKSPAAMFVQYALLFAAIGGGLWMIVAGLVVEPPARLMEALNRSNERILRLFGRPVTA